MNNLKSQLTRNLKPYSKYIPDISKPTMRTMMKLCVAFLENKKYSREAYDKEVSKMTAMNTERPKDYEIYCTIIMILLETFLKSNWSPKSGDDLSAILKELKFQDECVEDLSKVLTANQDSLFEHFQDMKQTKQKNKLEYRINISLMESGQPPTVILHHMNEKAEEKTINLSVKDFHRLRLSVASALSEVQALEGKRNQA